MIFGVVFVSFPNAETSWFLLLTVYTFEDDAFDPPVVPVEYAPQPSLDPNVWWPKSAAFAPAGVNPKNKAVANITFFIHYVPPFSIL